MSLPFFIKVFSKGKHVFKNIDSFGAKCPNSKCDAKFVWNWCYDTYYMWPSNCEAILAEEIKISEMDGWEPKHMIHWYCPKCGEWLGKEKYRKIDKHSSEIAIIGNRKWNRIIWDNWKYSHPKQ